MGCLQGRSRRAQIQLNRFKLKKDLSDSQRMRGRGIDRERSLVSSYKIVIGSTQLFFLLIIVYFV